MNENIVDASLRDASLRSRSDRSALAEAAPRYGGSLADVESLAAFLRSRGFTTIASQAKAALFAACAAVLEPDPAASNVARAYFVPGRIEVLGKHTDYAGGSSLVAAADRGFCLVAAATRNPQLIVTDAARGETIEFPMTADLTPTVGDWSNYPMTVVRRLIRNFPGSTRGAQIAFASDLPPAAGMSSSSALMVGIFFALADANDLWHHQCFLPELNEPLNLAGYLATIENGQSYGPLAGDRGVGTFGGSEDHTAILCARSGFVRQYAYCPVRFEREMPLPHAYTFAVASSGVVAEKTGAALDKYNRASRSAAAVAEIWRRETGGDEPHLAAVVRSQADAADRLRAILAAGQHDAFSNRDLQARFEHFLTENEHVIPAAGAALDCGDVEPLAAGWIVHSRLPRSYWETRFPKRFTSRRRRGNSAPSPLRRSVRGLAAASGRWSPSIGPTISWQHGSKLMANVSQNTGRRRRSSRPPPARHYAGSRDEVWLRPRGQVKGG